MTSTLDRPTATLDEILSQPKCWADCFIYLEQMESIRRICTHIPPDGEWLFVGCGSSYYIALSAASTFATITGMPARAVPASELMFYPDMVLGKRRTTIPVMISRSGRTTEVVRVAEYLERERGIRTIAATCYAEEPLAKTSALSIVLGTAAEKSMVMTRSFSSLLMGLQFLAASVAKNEAFVEDLRQLPSRSEELFRTAPALIKNFVASHSFEHYSFLGQGPFFGIANEAMLKVTESSCSYTGVFNSLEFRHGPKSIVNPRSLLGMYISDQAYDAEVDLLEEMKALGATTMTVTSKPTDRIRKATDLLIEVPSAGHEFSRLAACALPGQLLGLYSGLKKGLNPDAPPNLSQVVVLNGKV